MEYDLLGWPPDGPRLRLDYERFSYAGKFVMSTTGKAVARDVSEEGGGLGADTHETDGLERTDERDGSESASDSELDAASGSGPEPESEPESGLPPADPSIVAAVAFNEDRTDPDALWLRYVTVARDRRGEGIGPDLCAFVRDRARERGYDRLRIAVNNPFAYEALYRAGFAYTGETTGIAELVLEFPTPVDESAATDRYHSGLEKFRERDRSAAETQFLESRRDSEPPGLEF